MANAEAVRDVHPVHEELGGYEGAKMGMWLFLATELLLFGVLFAGFIIFHAIFPDAFKLAHNSLTVWQGATNTVILIVSSLTVALALDSIQRGKRKLASLMLVGTIVFASGFLVVKFFEYKGKFQHNIFPGSAAMIVDPAKKAAGATDYYVPTKEYVAAYVDKLAAAGEFKGNAAEMQEAKEMRAQRMTNGINLFFTFYFIMTGVHGLHVLIGMSVLGGILYYNIKGRYSHWYYTPVENGALYWHLVDLIWIYLFPLFYLIK